MLSSPVERKLYSAGKDTPGISIHWVNNDLYWSIEAPIATGDNVDNYIIMDGQVYNKDILYPVILGAIYLRPIFPVPAEVINDRDILGYLQERIGDEEIGTAIKALLKARESKETY